MMLRLVLLLAALALPSFASAQPADASLFDGGGLFGVPAVKITTNPDGSQDYTVTIQILALMTALTLLPALLMMVTAFTRIIIVFSILRQALGLQQTPSNQILHGLSLFLTLFVMHPVFEAADAQALQPYLHEEIGAREALERVRQPFADFMLAQTRTNDLQLFLRVAGTDVVDGPEAIPFTVLVPAFVTSELKTAFQIGFLLFVPFLVIDMVVASILMSMGMMMLPPVMISLPFKLIFFVLVDGWGLVAGSLVKSFRT
jgi:flagellar biosynthetic protein FliP